MAQRTWALAALAICCGSPAVAQNVDPANGVNQLLALARNYGSAVLQSQDNGDPKIVLTDNTGTVSVLLFHDCTNGNRCRTVTFYAGFADVKPTLETINAWNRDKRFGTAYLDADLDASVRYDVSLDLGITAENARAAFEVWKLVLGDYVTHVGYQP